MRFSDLYVKPIEIPRDYFSELEQRHTGTISVLLRIRSERFAILPPLP